MLGTVEQVRGSGGWAIFSPPSSPTLPALLAIPIIGSIRSILAQQNIMVYLAYALVPVAWFVLYRDHAGPQDRAGREPGRGRRSGVSVACTCYATVKFGGIMAGIAGASLSIALLNVFHRT